MACALAFLHAIKHLKKSLLHFRKYSMLNIKNILRAFLFVFFCMPILSFAQSAPDALTKQLDDILSSSGFPGFAVAVTKDDKTLYERGFGYKDRATKVPYTMDVIQPVGSVSKTVIGLALMKAVEMGVCSLDADINDYLPFKIQNPHRPQDRITLRHLATHTSGLLDNEEIYIATYAITKTPNVTLADFVRDYYVPSGKNYNKNNFAKTETGKQYAYSNIASALAAYIIEVRTKTSFDAFTEREIFTPLGMTSTHWQHRDDMQSRYATLYEINKQTSQLYKQILNADNSLKAYSCITYPDGGLRTSATDLVKYVKAMMKANAAPSNAASVGILRAESYATLFKKQFSTDTMPANMDRREPNRAIFWAYARNENLRHTGSDAGVFAFVSFNPKTGIGRVFTMNAQIDGEDNERAVKSFIAIVAALDKFEGAQ
jgi:CubicO group peptidase (beta-lactamase class C family)